MQEGAAGAVPDVGYQPGAREFGCVRTRKERRRWKKARCERIESVRIVLKVVDIMTVVFKAVKRLLEWRKKEKRAVRTVM